MVAEINQLNCEVEYHGITKDMPEEPLTRIFGNELVDWFCIAIISLRQNQRYICQYL